MPSFVGVSLTMTRMPATRMALLVSAAALLLALTSGCASHDPEPQRGLAEVFSVGDCVSIPAKAPDTLSATKVSCSADPSYTVGAMANGSESCPSAEYQHVPTKFADPSTTQLCLVPNLVADHCYVLDMPIGMLALADCAERGQQGLLVQVTQRLDVRDQQACPASAGQYAWPYPSPPRTYCTLTIF
jgi:hypothetical protein